MPLPLATHSISIWHPDLTTDDVSTSSVGFAASAAAATGVAAVISSPKGSEVVVGGQKSLRDLHLTADYQDIRHTSVIGDEATGDLFSVTWSQWRPGLGLDHTEAGIRRVEGQA